MRKEELENLFLESASPKIGQKVRHLRLDEDFKKKADTLRKKWKYLVKEFNNCYIKIEGLLYSKFVNNKIKITLFSQKEKNAIGRFAKKMEKIVLNDKFEKDIIKLTRETKLYPIEYWKNVVLMYVLTKYFFPTTYFLKLGLENYISKNELFKVPAKLNFAPKITKNKKTKELELFIQIFENTSLQDLKSNWRLVNELQGVLRKNKGITKRYYPQKNLEVFKKIKDLQKKGKSNWEIQEDIFGEIPGLNFGKKEIKRKNQIKQLIHQYKKRGVI